MAKQHHNFEKSDDGLGAGQAHRLQIALTQQEVTQLLDALLTVLSPELQEQAIAHLPKDTQQTIRQILAIAPDESQNLSDAQSVSLAKQAQTWADLWQTWDDIVSEASEERGKYLVQEAHWEPPYFDSTAFTDDLEQVAARMYPLLQLAFEYEFSPNDGFASALLDAESGISMGLEDWMEMPEDLYLGYFTTNCFLRWEALLAQEQEQDTFQLAKRIREHEVQFDAIELGDAALFDFFIERPEAEQRLLLAGFTADRETPFWQGILGSTASVWHRLYLHLVEQYAPDRYLDNLRKTISQEWQNGLPVIEALLAEQNYSESLTVIQETLHSFFKNTRGQENWTPEGSLFIAASGFYYEGEQASAGQLLRFYQKTAQGLNQTERANALEMQCVAIAQQSNWSAMFKAFADIPLAEPTRQALFTSWRDLVDRRSKPSSSWGGYGTVKKVDSWWLTWLIDSVADAHKGASWFQHQIRQWLTQLPGDKQQLGENYDVLRLLTQDLTEIQNNGRPEYPQFYRVVIAPHTASLKTDKSRQEYLQQYAPADLLDQVMNYWKINLQNFVPTPQSASKSDYTPHAQWMKALKEVSPKSYETLLAQWRSDHQRRSNLWRAMKEAGLN